MGTGSREKTGADGWQIADGGAASEGGIPGAEWIRGTAAERGGSPDGRRSGATESCFGGK